ncbi:MAG: hypothetical protein LBK99_01585 [Opitutaceae bacterium]|jgi:hypothetical protein|nr:hypothetical protein [Opitutaceae bacterium]
MALPIDTGDASGADWSFGGFLTGMLNQAGDVAIDLAKTKIAEKQAVADIKTTAVSGTVATTPGTTGTGGTAAAPSGITGTQIAIAAGALAVLGLGGLFLVISRK